MSGQVESRFDVLPADHEERMEPFGEIDRFLDGGARMSTDAHSPEVYRALLTVALDAVAVGEAQ